jgi:hypothetical protein
MGNHTLLPQLVEFGCLRPKLFKFVCKPNLLQTLVFQARADSISTQLRSQFELVADDQTQLDQVVVLKYVEYGLQEVRLNLIEINLILVINSYGVVCLARLAQLIQLLLHFFTEQRYVKDYLFYYSIFDLFLRLYQSDGAAI